MVHPKVNGVWVKQAELHAGNVLYKHSTASLFLYAKEKSGNWIIAAVLEGEPRFYFAWPNNGQLPMEEGQFYVSYSSPFEPSKFVITYGDPTTTTTTTTTTTPTPSGMRLIKNHN